MQSEECKRIPQRMMNYAKIPHKSTIHLYRGLSTRSLLYCRSWTGNCTEGVHTRTKGKQTFPIPWEVCHLSSTMGGVQIVSTTMPAKQGESSNSLATWAKCKRTEFTCPQRRNKIWQTKSLSHHVLRWKNALQKLSKKIEKKLFARQLTSRKNHSEICVGLEEFRRLKHASGNREDIARRGTLTQFHQRVAIGRTRIYKDKQYIHRIKEFSSMMLSRHRHIIPKLKRSLRRCTQMSTLDRFQIIQ